MVAFTDSAGLVTLAWVTNAGKLRNFRNRGVQVVLFQARQSFPEGVDTLSEEVRKYRHQNNQPKPNVIFIPYLTFSFSVHRSHMA